MQNKAEQLESSIAVLRAEMRQCRNTLAALELAEITLVKQLDKLTGEQQSIEDYQKKKPPARVPGLPDETKGQPDPDLDENSKTYYKPDQPTAPRGEYGDRPRKPVKDWAKGAVADTVNYIIPYLQKNPNGITIIEVEKILNVNWQNVKYAMSKLYEQEPKLYFFGFRKDWNVNPGKTLKGIRLRPKLEEEEVNENS